MRNYFIALFCTISLLGFGQKIKSPYEYFSHYGIHHTPHHKIAEYLRYLDLSSDLLQIEAYGTSNQGRDMMTLFISSAVNLKNLENIRKTHLYNIGLEKEKPSTLIERSITWCSFGVHGNEAGTTESVMNIAYTLITASDPKTLSWLDKSIVAIDPSLNPDGYDRYVHFLKSVTGEQLHPDRSDREHIEPWPTGRYNHYLFDLNRDWAWQTQKESQQRNARYNKWMPHIHADFHEMGVNAGYYFAPAAEPYHKYISDFQREFQNRIGRNHAKYFDQKGWRYWTREVFDLFYPSYGDTYPTYNGAIGMTYEQAGNSSSGRSVKLDNGDTLTINDKILHNTTVALSTVEMGAENHQELINNFKKFFADSQSKPKGKYMTYVFKKHPSLDRLTTLLNRTGIEYGFADKAQKLSGAYKYATKNTITASIEKGDLVIQTKQPKSVLLQILMEEESILADSLTYDITAWALPYAYGGDCYGFVSSQNISTTPTYKEPASINAQNCQRPVAYYIPWDDVSKAKLLGKLHQKGIVSRMAIKSTTIDQIVIQKGTIVISRSDNRKFKDFDNEVRTILQGYASCGCLSDGWAEKIGDLGGDYFQLLMAPKVLTFSNADISANSIGEIWHYFDQEIGYPVSIVDWDKIGRVKLSDFNTIILPDGWYDVSVSQANRFNEWVKNGGRMILIGQANNYSSDVSGIKLEKYTISEDQDKAKLADSLAVLQARYHTYEGYDRRSISKSTAGTVVKNFIDNSHPLGFGLGSEYYSLKTSDQFYPLQKSFWNVGRVPKSYYSAGFIGAGLRKNLEESMTFGVKNMGQGQAIFMIDNPLFRGFWDRGHLIFSNAVFLNTVVSDNY
jgi:hypothetical protein